MIKNFSKLMVIGAGVFVLAGVVGGAEAASRSYGRVVAMRGTTGGTRVTINRGRKHGVRTGTRIYFLNRNSRRYLRIDGKKVGFKVTSAKWNECSGIVKLTQDTVKIHRKVKLRGLRRKPVRRAKVVWVQGTRGGARVIVNRGRRAGLRKGSRVYFLRGNSDLLLRSGGRRVTFRCESVTRNECKGVVKLTIDQVKANRYVKAGRRS